MKKIITLITVAGILMAMSSSAQEKKTTSSSAGVLHRYVIERNIPNAGKLSEQELIGISTQSCATMAKMNQPIQWVQSYVTDDKVYCVYLASSEEVVRQHAKLGGFPVTKISEVKTVIDPTTSK